METKQAHPPQVKIGFIPRAWDLFLAEWRQWVVATVSRIVLVFAVYMWLSPWCERLAGVPPYTFRHLRPDWWHKLVFDPSLPPFRRFACKCVVNALAAAILDVPLTSMALCQVRGGRVNAWNAFRHPGPPLVTVALPAALAVVFGLLGHLSILLTPFLTAVTLFVIPIVVDERIPIRVAFWRSAAALGPCLIPVTLLVLLLAGVQCLGCCCCFGVTEPLARLVVCLLYEDWRVSAP